MASSYSESRPATPPARGGALPADETEPAQGVTATSGCLVASWLAAGLGALAWLVRGALLQTPILYVAAVILAAVLVLGLFPAVAMALFQEEVSWSELLQRLARRARFLVIGLVLTLLVALGAYLRAEFGPGLRPAPVPAFTARVLPPDERALASQPVLENMESGASRSVGAPAAVQPSAPAADAVPVCVTPTPSPATVSTTAPSSAATSPATAEPAPATPGTPAPAQTPAPATTASATAAATAAALRPTSAVPAETLVTESVQTANEQLVRFIADPAASRADLQGYFCGEKAWRDVNGYLDRFAKTQGSGVKASFATSGIKTPVQGQDYRWQLDQTEAWEYIATDGKKRYERAAYRYWVVELPEATPRFCIDEFTTLK